MRTIPARGSQTAETTSRVETRILPINAVPRKQITHRPHANRDGGAAAAYLLNLGQGVDGVVRGHGHRRHRRRRGGCRRPRGVLRVLEVEGHGEVGRGRGRRRNGLRRHRGRGGEDGRQGRSRAGVEAGSPEPWVAERWRAVEGSAGPAVRGCGWREKGCGVFRLWWCDRVASRGSSVRTAGTKGVERSGSVWCGGVVLWTEEGVDEEKGRGGDPRLG